MNKRPLVLVLVALLFVVALSSCCGDAGDLPFQRFASHKHQGRSVYQTLYGKPGAANCTTHWITQYVDHFTFAPVAAAKQDGLYSYEERYLVFENYFRKGGPIFFYAGNEGPIDAFANIAGLMWENAPRFNALLVFAEHRFYGLSQPCGAKRKDCLRYSGTTQALADFARLLTNLTQGQYSTSRGVITFGGSYGGMMSYWMRLKYPNIVTGAIASSAPIVMESSTCDRSAYWSVVTRAATAAGGAAPQCAQNVYNAIQAAFAMIDTDATKFSELFKLCKPVQQGSQKAKEQFGFFVQTAFDVYAMGDYPVPLDFMFGTPTHPAPAWPMRVACNHLAAQSYPSNETLLQGLMSAISVVYNVTEESRCYNIEVKRPSPSTWDYAVCSEFAINEIPYFSAKGWPHDMFYLQQPWTRATYKKHCMDAYGVEPRYELLNTTYGAGNLAGASNVIFANGMLDPWHSGGILRNVSDTVRSYVIQFGAHHLDLLFSSPSDPPGASFVRQEEMRFVQKWLNGLSSN